MDFDSLDIILQWHDNLIFGHLGPGCWGASTNINQKQWVGLGDSPASALVHLAIELRKTIVESSKIVEMMVEQGEIT